MSKVPFVIMGLMGFPLTAIAAYKVAKTVTEVAEEIANTSEQGNSVCNNGTFEDRG